MNRTEILASGIQKTTFSLDNGAELAAVIKHLDIPTGQWITKVYVQAPPAGLSIAEAKELSSAIQTIANEFEASESVRPDHHPV